MPFSQENKSTFWENISCWEKQETNSLFKKYLKNNALVHLGKNIFSQNILLFSLENDKKIFSHFVKKIFILCKQQQQQQQQQQLHLNEN